MSKNTVRKYVQSLEGKGLISTEPTSVITRDGRKQNGNLMYTIRPIKEAIERKNTQTLNNISSQIKIQKAKNKLQNAK